MPANPWESSAPVHRPPRAPLPLASSRPPSAEFEEDDDILDAAAIAPYEGKFAEVMRRLGDKKPNDALAFASSWRDEDPGDALALVGLGEAYEALGDAGQAARAFGSIIDLFPGRADLRRFAGARLERVAKGTDAVLWLAVDTYKKAVASRPDHPSGHRMLAYALARAGHHEEAFEAILAAFVRRYPSGRFAGVRRVLADDVGILGAVFVKAHPERKADVEKRLREIGVPLATRPSLRFVLTWETDANDVDFHILDGRRGHAYFRRPRLRSGGELFADVTTGYGPECFAIDGRAAAYPYRLRAHYYSKGPMGYGMGKLEIVEHDGSGGIKLEERPFVVMTDRAFVDLGVVTGPLKGP
jgi:tetratricopeptide (TPR) repeat protein